jgi:hypothetical protein
VSDVLRVDFARVEFHRSRQLDAREHRFDDANELHAENAVANSLLVEPLVRMLLTRQQLWHKNSELVFTTRK